MSVAVYPRLGDVLASRNVTVPELERQIKERFGLSVKPELLYWLLLAEQPVQQVDLQVVGAAAAVLDVALDDLFAVETAPNGVSGKTDKPILGLRDSRRLALLLDKQGRATFSDAESAELEALVARYRHLLHERRLREIARQQGITVEQARREAAAQVDEALRWWRTFNGDPQRRQEMAEQVARRAAALHLSSRDCPEFPG